MSSTSTTQYYGLTQYVGSDKPSFLDNNEAFAEIDGDLHECVVGVGEQAEAISAIRATVVQLGESVTTLSGDLDTEKGKIVAIQIKNQQQDLDIAGVKADALDMICAFNEAAATSTHAYEIGDYFRYNDVLYKATAAIAVGETIVPNVNCAATNVSEELLNIEEVDLSALQPKEDNSLETTSKEIVGAINEVNTGLGDLINPPVESVTGNGVKSYSTLLGELFAQIDLTKLTARSALMMGDSCMHIVDMSTTKCSFGLCSVGADGETNSYVFMSSGNYTYKIGRLGSAVDLSSNVVADGTVIKLVY